MIFLVLSQKPFMHTQLSPGIADVDQLQAVGTRALPAPDAAFRRKLIVIRRSARFSAGSMNCYAAVHHVS